MRSFMPHFASPEELREHQLKGLKFTVKHAYSNSRFYRKRLDQAGVIPEDIKTIEDIRKLPFTTANDFDTDYPFAFLSVPEENVLRIHASSGTTGKRKIVCYTRKDLEDWTNMFARVWELGGLNEKDRVQIATGYGLWTAGISFQLSVEKFGAMAIPIGPGNMDLQCQFLVDFQTTVSAGTTSFNLLLGEEVRRRGIRDKIKLRKSVVGSERTSDAAAARIKELLGVDDLIDITGMTELYGPGMGTECAFHTGHHYWADYYILEILNPETFEPVKEGELGEMVYTTLQKEATPLIRYRSRDLSRIIPGSCPCGSILPRHSKLVGRSDDMFIFRAVNIYPSQIDEVISSIKGVGSEYQVQLDRQEDGKDHMAVRVERAAGNRTEDPAILASNIEREVKNKILVSCRVEIVDYETLPRSERKTKRIFDNR